MMDYQKTVYDFFADKGKAEGLEYDADLFAGGFVDSLFALEIVMYLEETFRFRIGNRDLTEDNFRTVTSIAVLVERLCSGE